MENGITVTKINRKNRWLDSDEYFTILGIYECWNKLKDISKIGYGVVEK